MVAARLHGPRLRFPSLLIRRLWSDSFDGGSSAECQREGMTNVRWQANRSKTAGLVRKDLRLAARELPFAENPFPRNYCKVANLGADCSQVKDYKTLDRTLEVIILIIMISDNQDSEFIGAEQPGPIAGACPGRSHWKPAPSHNVKVMIKKKLGPESQTQRSWLQRYMLLPSHNAPPPAHRLSTCPPCR